MNSVATNVWDTVLLSLKTKLNQQTLDTWFQPIKFERLDTTQRVITLRVPNHVVKDWVVTNYSVTIEESLRTLLLDNYSLAWQIDGESAQVSEQRPIVSGAPQQLSPTSYSANLAGDGLRQDWGPSAFDRRHIFTIAYVYSPKGLRSDNMAANAVLGLLTRNFTISGQTELYSGLYTSFNVSGRDINGDSSSTNDRPILSNASEPITMVGVDGSYIGGVSGTYYDYAAYNASPSTARVRTVVSPGAVHFLVPKASVGALLVSQEVGRNSYLNPGQQYWNLALEKAFPTHFRHMERGQFLFRVEAQQIGNHNNITYYTNNVTQVGTTAFQDPSNAREPNNQHLRLWAKYQF